MGVNSIQASASFPGPCFFHPHSPYKHCHCLNLNSLILSLVTSWCGVKVANHAIIASYDHSHAPDLVLRSQTLGEDVAVRLCLTVAESFTDKILWEHCMSLPSVLLTMDS